MGAVALTWRDLEVWENAWGLSLQPWQKQLLIALSAAYLSEWQAADEHDAPPPWVPKVDRAKVAEHIRSVIRGT